MTNKMDLTRQINKILALHDQILELAQSEDWTPLLDLCRERYSLCQKIFRHENYEYLHKFEVELKQIKKLDAELLESFKPIFDGSVKRIYVNKKQLESCREYRNSYSVK